MSVRRFGAVRFDRAVPTPTGGLRIDATPTRIGVFTYRDAAGATIRELRHPEDVFHPDSLASLRGAAVTDLHPPTPVTPDNFKEYAVGHVGDSVEIAPDKVHVQAPVYVNDGALLPLVTSGERSELSCGYVADIDDTPGVFDGQPYDARQRNIRYNHLALLPPGTGRAGSTVRLRLDATDRVLVHSDETKGPMKIRIDGKEYDAGSAEAQAAITALEKARDEALGAIAAGETARKTLQTKLDAALDPKALSARVAERTRVLDGVNKIRVAKGAKRLDAEGEPDVSGTSSEELVLAALKLWDPSFDPANKSPDFIAGAFWSTLKHMTSAGPAETTVEPVDGVTSDEPHDPAVPSGPSIDAPPRQDSAGARNILRGRGPAPTNRADQNETPRHERPLAYSKDR